MTGTTSIYLIRHGDVDNPSGTFYGRSINVSLSQEGEQQISDLAQVFKNRGVAPQVIYTSPLMRTVQTAQILSKQFGRVPVISDAALLETYSQGLEGYPVTKILAIADIYSRPPSGVKMESHESILERMMRIIDLIKKNDSGKTIFIVGHGDPLAFIRWRLEFPDRDIPPVQDLQGSGRYLGKAEAWKVLVTEANFRVDPEKITFREVNFKRKESK